MSFINFYKTIYTDKIVNLFNYSNNSLFEGLYRYLAILISPIFIKFNANFISFLSLVCAFLAFVFFKLLDCKLNYILIFFFISFILDFTDGLVARYQNKSSFYGRFIDGMFDIIVIGFIHIIFLDYLTNQTFYFLNLNFFYFCIFLLPMQHLILDRYSSMARWCNSVNDNNQISHYLRNKKLKNITMILFDMQNLCLLIILLLKESNFIILIQLYFFFSFLASILSILLYTISAYKNFYNTSNQLDNKD
jgi:phosphatidylglycerophosphate synthase